ncbi:hypothetical protein LINPERHAP1_LOCUS40822, partial [Linum perenne]
LNHVVTIQDEDDDHNQSADVLHQYFHGRCTLTQHIDNASDRKKGPHTLSRGIQGRYEKVSFRMVGISSLVD